MEHIFEHNKQYRIVNSEKIKEKKNTKIICSCGKTTTNGHKARHERSKYCIKNSPDKTVNLTDPKHQALKPDPITIYV